MNPRVIALVDCNSFYCSCERLFRPDLRSKPVVVLSHNDGCAISRTDEAKALGIKMGEAYFEFKHLSKSHGLHVFSSNFPLYANISDRVMKTLKRLAPEIEVYSIDEAFLDLSGIQKISDYGHEIKNTILTHIGIPVGVGIGPTKVLAKVANRIAKKSTRANGVVNLLERRFQDIALAQTPIEDVWGVGQRSSQKMLSLGIRTAKDLRDFKNEKLIQSIFTKVGLQMKHELMGISCFPFNGRNNPKKEIMCSRSFASGVSELSVLKESVANYVTDAAEKMRAQNSLCQQICVFARTSPFKHSEEPFYLFESRKLHTPTQDTRKLIINAWELLERGFRPGHEFKKAGVKLSDFYSSLEHQLDFLFPMDDPLDMSLMQMMDRINHCQGQRLVKSAACGVSEESWKMNRNFRSPRYTTSWDELPQVK